MTGIIVIDLQNTFDTIDLDILFKKLSAIDVSNHLLSRFKSYLSNGLFRVTLENSYSDPSNITGGLPEGPVLRPFLFLIYGNGITQNVK